MNASLVIGIGLLLFILVGFSLFLLIKTQQKITYKKEIYTTFDQEQLWENLKKIFKNSRDSHMWPNELELLYSENGLALDAEFTVTYKTTSTPQTYTYVITDYREGDSFSYKAIEEHPYDGGGTVEVVFNNGKTVLRWTIIYTHRTSRLNAFYMKYVFFRKFFNALEQRVKDLEPPKDLV